MTTIRTKIVFILMAYLPIFSMASIPRLQAPTGKAEKYIDNGLIRGGEAARAFSLIDLRWAYGKEKGIERLIFEFGDGRGETLKTRPGYFQVNVDKATSTVTIDFSQVAGSRIDQAELTKRLRASPYIKNLKMNYDPVDSTLSLSFKAARPVKVEAFELPLSPKGGRLAIDIKRI